MIIPCKCLECEKTVSVYFEEQYYFCIECQQKKFETIVFQVNKWRTVKMVSYFCLITMPLTLLIGFRYGLKIQLIFSGAVLLGQVIGPLVDWLAEKF